MVLTKPAILDRKLKYTGYLTVETLRIRLADEFVVSRDVGRHGNAVVLPYNCMRKCALVGRLLRAPVFDTTGEDSIEEACAGFAALSWP